MHICRRCKIIQNMNLKTGLAPGARTIIQEFSSGKAITFQEFNCGLLAPYNALQWHSECAGLKHDWGCHVPAHMLTWTAHISVPAARLARILKRPNGRLHPFTWLKPTLFWIFDSSFNLLSHSIANASSRFWGGGRCPSAAALLHCADKSHLQWRGHAEQDAEGTEDESESDVEKEFDESTGMLAWEIFSPFVCNGSIQAWLISTTFFAYVICAIMTHFSDRLFATQPEMISSSSWHTSL